VFAAGDIRAKGLYQIVTAAADGANAATAAAIFISSIKEEF
jgi:thioredoxin reductase (NADPH)